MLLPCSFRFEDSGLTIMACGREKMRYKFC